MAGKRRYDKEVSVLWQGTVATAALPYGNGFDTISQFLRQVFEAPGSVAYNTLRFASAPAGIKLIERSTGLTLEMTGSNPNSSLSTQRSIRAISGQTIQVYPTAGAVQNGQLLQVNAAGAVLPATLPTQRIIGVAMHDADNAAIVWVCLGGICWVRTPAGAGPAYNIPLTSNATSEAVAAVATNVTCLYRTPMATTVVGGVTFMQAMFHGPSIIA